MRGGGGPSSAVVAAVAAEYGARWRDELLSLLVELIPTDPGGDLDAELDAALDDARRCAEALRRLGAELPDRARRDLVSAAHLIVGNAAADLGLVPTAVAELRAARELLGPDLAREQIPGV